MVRHTQIEDTALRSKIKKQLICFAGNTKLEIYGKLNCASGKRMKKENRIFFSSQREAIESGFRPCGHCLREEYINWKYGLVQ